MSRVVEDDKTFRKLLDLTLREKKLLNTLLSKEKSRSQSPGVGVLQTRFSPCPLSAKERESISVLRKEKNYSTLSSANSSNNNSASSKSGSSSSSSEASEDTCGRIKKPTTTTRLSGSGSRKGTKGARISLKGETCDINVSLSDEATAAFRNANQRHRAELGKCWTSRIPKEFIPKDERHEAGNLIREMAMEKVSFFLTFDRTPGSRDYYEKIFNYVNGIEEEDDDGDYCDDDDLEEYSGGGDGAEDFGSDIAEMGGLSFKTFGAGGTAGACCGGFGGCCGGVNGEDDIDFDFDDDDDENDNSAYALKPSTSSSSSTASSLSSPSGILQASGIFKPKFGDLLEKNEGEDDLKTSDQDFFDVNEKRGLTLLRKPK